MAVLRQPPKKELDLVKILHALGDPIRLKLVINLFQTQNNSCVGACEAQKISKSTLSHHFKILRAAGLVESRKVGVKHVNCIRADDVEARFPGLLESVFKSMCPKKQK